MSFTQRLLATLCFLLMASGLQAQSNSHILQVSHCDCGEAACGCEPEPGCGLEPVWVENASDPGCGIEADCGVEPGCGFPPACGTESSGEVWLATEPSCGIGDCSGCTSCGGGLFDGGGLFGGRAGGCDLGDPFAVLGECNGFKMGGWVQFGYHNRNLSLFNSRKHELQLHQGWLFAEQEFDASQGFGWGGRVDYLFGTDGPDTQAFGINNSHWDNSWDHGADYGHALPQAYLETGYGKLTAKIGHFYTVIGYEVVSAPDNFFYSHAYTMYNSEPFTHTGAMLNYDYSTHVDVFGGYVMGWDSGFEDNGDAVLAGSSVNLSDSITVTSTMIAGRFADNSNGDERGFMSSTVVNVSLSDQLSYVLQADVLDTEDVAGLTVRETKGINQYLMYSFGECLSVGSRFEWWNVAADSQGFYGNAPAGLASTASGDFDVYGLTLGANIKPHANLLFRPEIRWDWVDGSQSDLATADIQILEGNEDRQTTFGLDAIVLF
ncbi:MAG: porin [Rubripirellula sp.]